MDRVVSTSQARQILAPLGFPNLSDTNFGLTSPRDALYNCIAWAAGDHTRWWWPSDPQGYWPTPQAPNEVTSFVEAFSGLGYEVCNDAELEAGFEKVAIYAKSGVPTHAARQLDDGRWTSKLGKSWDVWHNFDALNGPQYGEPVAILRRAINS